MINTKNLIMRLLVFLVACFLGALSYNMFLIPNNIVIGGMSGLAIIFKQLFGLSIPVFLNISMIVLFLLSSLFLNFKTSLITLFGAFCWNMMVMVSTPLAELLNIQFESHFLMILVVSLVHGICFGLVYRTGFNTGGSDTILLIMNKYLKMPMGLAGTWLNIFIITFGFFVCGPTKTLFAVFILILNNHITDQVTLGIRDSKMCFVKSEKTEEIEKYLINNMQMGVTEFQSKGGVFSKKDAMLLVIMSVDDYYGFKHLIKRFDEKAFIMTTDCYAVTGGYKKQIIPF